MEENKLEMTDAEQRRAVAKDVSDHIEYDFMDYYLVKPLAKIRVQKEFSKPIPEGDKTDETGAVEYEKVETEVKEVDSDFRRGVVLKLPRNYKGKDETANAEVQNIADIKVGDIILFRDRSCIYFDLLKDSVLVKHWDIIATVND